MRILTVRQPWAWAIIHGGKDIENRVRNVAGEYRGPVAIHGGLRDDENASTGLFYERAKWFWDRGHMYPGKLPKVEQGRGAIIGVVDLIGVHVVKRSQAGTNVCFDSTTPTGKLCSPWANAYDEFPAYRGHHLVLANPRALAEPIPYKGALGLRRLDDEMVARIEAAIA